MSASSAPPPRHLQSARGRSWRTWLQGLAQRSSERDDGVDSFDPERLTNEKQEWKALQVGNNLPASLLQSDRFIEHFVVVGVHPHADVSAVEAAFERHKRAELAGELADSDEMSGGGPSVYLEPQLLFKYPPRKRLALSTSDLPGFCFPNGVKARCMQRSPSMRDLHDIIYGQAHMKTDESSFVFLLKTEDNTPLYGVCMWVEEIVQRPPGVLAMNDAMSGQTMPPRQTMSGQATNGCDVGTAAAAAAAAAVAPPGGLPSRYLVMAPRCYCFLTRLPFFEFHFEVLNTFFPNGMGVGAS